MSDSVKKDVAFGTAFTQNTCTVSTKSPILSTLPLDWYYIKKADVVKICSTFLILTFITYVKTERLDVKLAKKNGEKIIGSLVNIST